MPTLRVRYTLVVEKEIDTDHYHDEETGQAVTDPDVALQLEQDYCKDDGYFIDALHSGDGSWELTVEKAE